MPDEFNQGQIIKVTAKLTNPADHTTVPLDADTGETLTPDASEALVAYRDADGSLAPVSGAANPSTGIYTALVTADQPGYFTVTDHEGGVYRFYVRAVPQ